MKKFMIFVAAVCLLLTACETNGTSPSISSETQGYVPIPSEPVVSIADRVEGTSADSAASAVSTAGSGFKASKAAASPTSSKPASSAASIASAPSSVSSLPPNVVRITFPEGYSISQIGDKLEEFGVCTKAAFLSTVNSYDFSYYKLVAAIPSNENRCYKLEGYLFPNTYEFYKNSKPQDVIGKMLRSAESNIGSKYSYPGMTTDEIITLASIIEKEANSTAEMAKISSVFHNRLKAGMKLQSDPTIHYIEWYVKPNLTGDINRYNSYYNTYKCSALPAGPICNPGAAALKAACNPADTDYLFFAADKQGNYYYATTFQEHVNNCISHGIISPESSSSLSNTSSAN